MGRTNYAILGIGLAACILLVLMMQHLLEYQKDRDVPPVVSELTQAFGARLSRSSEFRVSPEPGGRVGELVVYPLLSSSQQQLARVIGDYVWRRYDDQKAFDALVVACDDGLGRRVRFVVPHPRELGRGLREVGSREAVLPGGSPPRPAR